MPEPILVPIAGSPLAERAFRSPLENVPTASIKTRNDVGPVASIVAAETGKRNGRQTVTDTR